MEFTPILFRAASYSYAKIVKGERRMWSLLQYYSEPHPILMQRYEKASEECGVYSNIIPSRILSYAKIGNGEQREMGLFQKYSKVRKRNTQSKVHQSIL